MLRMGVRLKLGDELSISSEGRLSFSFSKHKAAAEPLGVLTPPLQPMVSVPFKWEEVPGRPKDTNPSPPHCAHSLDLRLPPRLFNSNGPQLGRALSDRFMFQCPPPNRLLGLQLKGAKENNLTAHIMSCRWPNQELPNWDIGERRNCKGTFDFLHSDDAAANADDINNMEVNIRRCKRRSNRNLHKLSHKTYCLLESICKSVKRAVRPKRKDKKQGRGAPE